jgi:hypothetical protein
MPDQWIRKVGLLVSSGDSGLDLSQMRIRFKTQNAESGVPNTAWIRVYNLKEETANRFRKEFQDVSLQAGYEGGKFGVIFSGQIMQTKIGREDNLDSYVDIMAADADLAHSFGFVSKSLAAKSSRSDVLNAITGALQDKNVTVDKDATQSLTPTGGVLARGKVLWGLAAPMLTGLTETAGASWSIQNGVLQIVPTKGYKDGEAVKLNSATGMIGVPEATQDGVHVRTLLNPLIAIGGRIQIDNKSINQTSVIKPSGYPNFKTPPPMYASTTNDGYYRVLVCEHSGDIRGQEWYSDITCLTLD